MQNPTVEEAEKLQKELSKKVIQGDFLGPFSPDMKVAGVDVAYEKDGTRVVASIATINPVSFEVIEKVTHVEEESFPYIPGLFSFRELPPVLGASAKLQNIPDLIVVDGQGFAHPRRFGLACHLGVQLDIPTIGCAKKRLIGEFEPPANERGSYSDLIDNGEVIGRVLRTQDGIKPVFVSIGHKMTLDAACDWILRLTSKYRLPETTRVADHEVNMVMKSLG